MPPKDWWDYPKVGDPLAEREKASRPGERLGDAWRQLLRGGAVGLRMGESDFCRLLAPLAPTVDWEPAAGNRQVTLTGDDTSFGLKDKDSVSVKRLEVKPQQLKATGVSVEGMRVEWKGTKSFHGRVKVVEIQLGAADRRLSDFTGEVAVTPSTELTPSTGLKVTSPSAKVYLGGVNFQVSGKTAPWDLAMSPTGQLTGKLHLDLNEAGWVELQLLADRVRPLGANLNLAAVKEVQEKVSQAVSKAAFGVEVDLHALRIDTMANQMSIDLTLKKRVKVDLLVRKVDELVKLPIHENVDLKKAITDKKVVWEVKIGPLKVKVAEFELPINEIRKVIDLDAIQSAK